MHYTVQDVTTTMNKLVDYLWNHYETNYNFDSNSAYKYSLLCP